MKFIIKICIFLMIFSIYIPCYAEEVIPGAVSGILIDADSGKIIYEKNKNKKVAMLGASAAYILCGLFYVYTMIGTEYVPYISIFG